MEVRVQDLSKLVEQEKHKRHSSEVQMKLVRQEETQWKKLLGEAIEWKEMYEEKMQSALSLKKDERKNKECEPEDKQQEARRLLKGLDIELDSCHVLYLQEMGYL